MENYSKKQLDFLKEIERKIEAGDEDALNWLFKNQDAYAIRQGMGSALGKHVLDNYDDVNKIYSPDSLEALKGLKGEIVTKLPDNVAGSFNTKTDVIKLNQALESDPLRFTGNKLHERQHFLDKIKNKLFSPEALDDMSAMKAKGLSAASELFDPHHLGGFFEKEALGKLVRGAKLSHIPALAGAAALGTALYSSGAKAAEGDVKGAIEEAGDALIPDEVKIHGLGEGSDKPSANPKFGVYGKPVDDSSRSEKDVPMRYSDMQALSKKLNEAYKKKDGK